MMNILKKEKKFFIKNIIPCLLLIFVCYVIGYLSSLLQKDSLTEWYPMLEKSILTPPSFVFVIIWSVLYILLGISTFIAFKQSKKYEKTYILFIFFAQLCFNLLWNTFFFGMKLPFIALIEIISLVLITIVMMKFYKRFSNVSYFLLFPYLLWLIFATYLNLVIVVKN